MSTSSQLNQPTSGNKIKVTLSGVPETLLGTLHIRAADANSPRPILGDPYASAILSQLDYDFNAKAPLSPTQSATVTFRAKTFDNWTSDFLERNPSATVLHLACGLDSRAQRVKWGKGVRWIDVDLPEVVELRESILRDVPSLDMNGRDYRLMAADVTDDAWLADIPNDRPTIVIMEGLLSYLHEEQVKRLLKRLVDRFPKGELLVECLNWFMLYIQSWVHTFNRNAGAYFLCAVDEPKSLEAIDSNLKMLESVQFFAGSSMAALLPFSVRVFIWFTSWIPWTRDMWQLARFSF